MLGYGVKHGGENDDRRYYTLGKPLRLDICSSWLCISYTHFYNLSLPFLLKSRLAFFKADY